MVSLVVRVRARFAVMGDKGSGGGIGVASASRISRAFLIMRSSSVSSRCQPASENADDPRQISNPLANRDPKINSKAPQ
jgi:hypothetical protein